MTVNNVRHPAERINIEDILEENRPLADLTTFKVGGAARYFTAPSSWAEMHRARLWAGEQGVPFFLLGGGANILVADAGFPGLVAATTGLCSIESSGNVVTAEAGADMSAVCEAAAEAGLTGMEFIYSMPGSVGGAVWMNARCYGVSISDRIAWVDYLDMDGTPGRYVPQDEDFSYKRSPFQGNERIITSAGFLLESGDVQLIRSRMEDHKADREEKGHFRYPCAGSVFKNNRSFGAPAGQLIDALGLKGTRIGDAQIAPFHGNIIVNLGNARAAEIRELMLLTEKRVKEAYGFDLEREVLLIGDWPRAE